MKTLLAAWLLCSPAVQEESLESRIDKLLARMKESLTQRQKAAEEIADLIKADRKAIPVLREKARKEKDVRVRTRVEAIISLDAVEKGWETQVPGGVAGAIQLSAGRVWFPRGDGRIVALDAATGEQKLLTGPVGWSRFTVAGELLIGVKAGALQTLDTRSGRAADVAPLTAGPWSDGAGFAFLDGERKLRIHGKRKFEYGVPPTAQFAMADGKVLVYSGDDQILALSTDDGKQAWSAKADQGVNFFAAWDGLLVTRTKRFRLRAYEIATGKGAWMQELQGDEEREASLVRSNGRLYAFGPTMITVRELKTGALLWRGAPEWYLAGRVPVVLENLFALIDKGSIVLFNADTMGSERTRSDFGAVTSLVSDGKRLFFVSGDKVVAGDFSPARR